jgi:hypothetical protein
VEILPDEIGTQEDLLAYLGAGYCLVVEDELPARVVDGKERLAQKAQAFLVEARFDRGYTRGNVPLPADRMEALITDLSEHAGEGKEVAILKPEEAGRVRPLHLHREPTILCLRNKPASENSTEGEKQK